MSPLGPGTGLKERRRQFMQVNAACLNAAGLSAAGLNAARFWTVIIKAKI